MSRIPGVPDCFRPDDDARAVLFALDELKSARLGDVATRAHVTIPRTAEVLATFERVGCVESRPIDGDFGRMLYELRENGRTLVADCRAGER